MTLLEFVSTESFVYSAVSALLLGLGLMLGLRQSRRNLSQQGWNRIGRRLLSTRKVIRRLVLGLIFVTAISQLAYFSFGSFREGWDATTTTLGLLTACIAVLGALFEHNKAMFVWNQPAVRYTLYALVGVGLGFLGYLIAHPVPGVALCINLSVWFLLVVWGLMNTLDMRGPQGSLFLIRLTGWVCAAVALVFHAATLLLVT